MAGTAKTNAFMLGTATVMIGAQADLFKLTPDDHSIGLVKNFTMTAEPNYVELTQGVTNTIVDSQMNANAIRASMEVFEFTAKNLSYGLGLDGTTLDPLTVVGTVNTQVVGDGSTTDDIVLTTGGGTGFTAGDYLAIELDTDDGVMIRKLSSKSTDTLTIDKPIPTGTTVPAGAKVRKVHAINIGQKTAQPYFAAQVTGVLGNGDRVTVQIPKLRLVKGFSLAFSTQDYGNLPFEFTLYDLVSTDTFYSDFGASTARILRA